MEGVKGCLGRIGAISVMIASSVILLPPLPAHAVSCPDTGTWWPYEHIGAKQTPADGDLGGVRAPIENRKDGLVCEDGSANITTPWIGMQDNSGINQIGFLHKWSPQDNRGYYCRFWAIGIGVVHPYGCDQQTEGDNVYYKVVVVEDAFGVYRWEINDCGVGDNTYVTCTRKSAAGAVSGTPTALLVNESNYGDSYCTNRITGSVGDAQNIGNSNFPSQVKPDPTSTSWATPNWSFYRAAFKIRKTDGAHIGDPLNWCGSYDWNPDLGGGIVRTWDVRNAS